MSRETPELKVFRNEIKIFRAGAGAGKTTELVAEVYNYYCFYKSKNARNPKVVLTTFTRKATQELRERLMIEAQKKNDYDFLSFVLSKNQLMISTIHGVLQLFLKQYAQLLDLDPGFKLTNDKDLAKGAKIILKSLIAKDVRYLELLEEFPFSDLTTLVIKHYQTKIIDPDATFFDKDDFYNEQTKILAETAQMLSVYSDRISAETDNSKWLEYCQHLKTVSESFASAKNVIDIDRALSLLKSFRKPSFQTKNPPFTEALNKEFDEARLSISKLNVNQFDPALWDRLIENYKLFDSLACSFCDEFDSWKKTTGQISMSDLELYSYQLIRDYSAHVHFFSENFDYWLIDEFQDTSPLQKKLLLSFIKDRKYFVVGDPQQSIYFFRGARAKVFDEMEELVVSKKGIFELLNKNYRSSKSTMSFINYFFEHYSKNFKSMELGGKDSLTPAVAEIAIAVDKDSQKLAIINHILKLQASGVPLGEICVLGRKNDQLKAISAALQELKIPYIVHSASGFKDRREILDALAILKFLVNPHDNFNLIQVFRTPWFRIPDEEIYNTVKSRPTSFWNEFVKIGTFEVVALLRKYISDTYSIGITNTFQNMLMETGFLDLSFIYDPSGRRESNIWKLLVQLKTDDHSPDFNYLSFIQDRKSAIDLESGAEDSDAVSSIEPNRVQLMTVHMAKGLQFDHVIIPFIDSNPQLTNYLTYAYCEDSKKFGLHLKLGEEKGTASLSGQRVVREIKSEELNESDRLLYVAMTRAKKTLFMSTAGSRQNGASWFKKIKLDLSEGVHKQKNFEYNVSCGPWLPNYSTAKADNKVEVLNPIYDLSSLRKIESARVTSEVADKKHHKVALRLVEKANYGKLAHQVFESLKYGRSFGSDAKIQSAVNYIENLEAIPMSSILKDGFAEWGFVTKTDGKNMSGQIDLWGIVDNELWVIDYKTGSSTFSDFAFEQLSHYAQALKSYIGDAPILKTHLVALYPFEEKFILQSL